ncbi:TetR/AcrR family transcriptional regulator [Salipaludibacillus neizhouensis]|nr:TetR/AcrR family transcriptional regulator [Salipaludibacillus neizhouensis]
MKYSTDNPIALKSQKWLVVALLELMKEKPYNKITIKEIAQKSELDRSTFYRNFSSKEDILNFHLDVLSQDYINRIEQTEDVDMRKVSNIFLEFCNDNLEFFCSLRRNGLSTFLLEAFNSRLPDIHRLVQNKFPYLISEENFEFALAFNAGGMWNLLMNWIDTGLKRPYSDLVNGFEEISYFNSKQ